MTASARQQSELAGLLEERWQEMGAKIGKLVSAFPEERFEDQPAANVRTFGAVVRHIAFWNFTPLIRCWENRRTMRRTSWLWRIIRRRIE